MDDYCRKQVAIDGKICIVEMVELPPAQQFFSFVWECWVQHLDGVAMVYSIGSRSSFMSVRACYHKITKVLIDKGRDIDDFPLFLIGNKSEIGITREVSTAEGIALAQEFCCDFIETSAKNAQHVEEPFFGIMRALQSLQVPQTVEIGNTPKRESKATYQGLFQYIRQLFRRRTPQTSVQSSGVEHSPGLNRKLVKASRNRDVPVVKKKLNYGVNMDEQSAFYAAAATGHSKIVKMLLAKGADISAKGPGCMPPLQRAALEGHANVVRILLENGAPVDKGARLHGTALSCACSRANIDVVRVLLDHGADVNAKGGLHGNALQAAATLGKVDLARLLLDAGANVDATGDGGYTALQVAAFPGRFDMIQLLLSRGAHPDLRLASPSPLSTSNSTQDDAGFLDVVSSHFDYGASEAVRASAQVIVDLVHQDMFGPVQKTEEKDFSQTNSQKTIRLDL